MQAQSADLNSSQLEMFTLLIYVKVELGWVLICHFFLFFCILL